METQRGACGREDHLRKAEWSLARCWMWAASLASWPRPSRREVDVIITCIYAYIIYILIR